MDLSRHYELDADGVGPDSARHRHERRVGTAPQFAVLEFLEVGWEPMFCHDSSEA